MDIFPNRLKRGPMMNPLILLLVIISCCASQAMDKRSEQSGHHRQRKTPSLGTRAHPIVIREEEETSLPSSQRSPKRVKPETSEKEANEAEANKKEGRPLRVIKPMKAIIRNPDKADHGKKTVRFKEELPEVAKTTVGIPTIVGTKFQLERISSAKEHAQLWNVLFKDAYIAREEKICGLTQAEATQNIGKLVAGSEYDLPLYFADYRVCDPTDKRIIGAVFFNHLHGIPLLEGYIETQVHIMSGDKRTGLVHEILCKLLSDLVKCKLETILPPSPQPPLADTVEAPIVSPDKLSVERSFKGIFGRRNILITTIRDTYAYLKSFQEAEFEFRVMGENIIMSNSLGSSNLGPALNASEINVLLVIAERLMKCRDYKMSLGSQMTQAVFEIREVVENPEQYRIYEKPIKAMINKYKTLLRVNEPHTFLSALNLLLDVFKVPKEEIALDLPPERALEILAVIEKQINLPPKLDILRGFTEKSL
jgi:hypothetical protein